MTPDEFRSRLATMTVEEESKYSLALMGNNWVEDVAVAMFASDPGFNARVCHAFGVPSQSDRTAIAAIDSARYARLAFYATLVGIVIAVAALVVSLRSMPR